MTKKLKKQVNKIAFVAFAIIATAITILCLNAEVFVMPMSLEDIDKTGISETVNAENDIEMASEGGIQPLADGDVIECKSIVQGARDNNIPDRKLHIQSSRNRQRRKS